MKRISCLLCSDTLATLYQDGRLGVSPAAVLHYQGEDDTADVRCLGCSIEHPIAPELFTKAFVDWNPEPAKSPREAPEPKHHEQYISGVRSWNVDEQGQLTGIAYKEPWSKEMTATCTSCRDTPGENHTCGLHAFYDLAQWRNQEDGYSYFGGNVFNPSTTAVGVISASGSAIIGEHGLRAQEAKIEALILYKPETKVLGETFSVEPYLRRIANRYGVPLIAPEEVEGFCEIQDLHRVDPQEMIGAESEIEDQAYSGPYSSGLYYSYPGGPMVPVNPIAQPKKTPADIISNAAKKMAEIVDKIDTQPKGGRKPFYEDVTKKSKKRI